MIDLKWFLEPHDPSFSSHFWILAAIALNQFHVAQLKQLIQ